MTRLLILGSAIFWGLLSMPLLAQNQQPAPSARDAAREAKIHERLTAINPAAVPVFQAATLALDSKDFGKAKTAYAEVLTLAPDFSDAVRRLSYVERELGNLPGAVELARKAWNAEKSPVNALGLAQILMLTKEPAHNPEILTLAKTAAQGLPELPDVWQILLLAGVLNKDIVTTRLATEPLLRLAPQSPYGHYFNGLFLADDKQWEKAEEEILVARELGMPEADVKRALRGDISTWALVHRLGRPAALWVVVWLAVGVILFLAGLQLSRLTMQAVQQAPPASGPLAAPGEQTVRQLYQVVILLASAYFYISIPFLVLLVLGAVSAIFYLFLLIGRIPLQLAAFVVIMAVYTLYAVGRCLFTRIRDDDPGRPLPFDEAPGLWALTREVAAQVGTRPVEEIYLTPGTEIAVMERGNWLVKLRGQGRRCLILGLGVLPGMNQGQLKAILAHEYGHFSNRDTAGGNLASQVRASMHEMAYGLIVKRENHWFNPAWLFVNGYYHLFTRITLGASRLQEILADRFAVAACGVRNFTAGLTHVVRQSLVFDLQVDGEVAQAIQEKRRLVNLYALPALAAEPLTKLETTFTEAMTRPTSPYDSHPAVGERLALVAKLAVAEPLAGSAESQPSVNLLPDIDRLQAEMTGQVQENVRTRVPDYDVTPAAPAIPG